ncbi:hypothetical protein [Aestuariivirga sp.]
MIHYYAELALWMAVLFLIGCPMGALARRLRDGRQRKKGVAS